MRYYIYLMFFVSLHNSLEVRAQKSWVQGLLDATRARDSILLSLDEFNIKPVTKEKIEHFVIMLDQYQDGLEDLKNLNDVTVQADAEITRQVLKVSQNSLVTKYFKNRRIETQFAERGLGHVLRNLKGFYDSLCVKKLFSKLKIGPKSYNNAIPVETICRPVLEDIQSGKDDGLDISNICTSLPRCAAQDETFSDPKGTNVKEACIDDTGACDVKKAVPMMTALLWYRISNFIAQAYCSNIRLNVKVPEIYKTHTRLLKGYLSTLEWDLFFKKAFRTQAYKDLQTAMELVEEREKAAKQATVACHELGATELCDVSNMYNQFEMLRKIKKERENPRRIRDLRKDANVDESGRLQLRLAVKRHNEVMGGITIINENLVQASEKLSRYFETLARFDEGIANADVEYISGKLREFNESFSRLSAKVHTDLKSVMIAMQTILSLQLAEEITIMGLKIADSLHPANVILGEIDPAGLLEQAGEVARATTETIKGISLLVNLDKLVNNTITLAEQFNNNAKQIKHIKAVVQGIQDGDLDSVSYDADRFIEEYGSYTPQVSGASIAKNDALWGAFKGATCDLLTGAQGVASEVGKAVPQGMLLCERLEGTIAEYTTVRQSIFDFQFDLVDAIAKVVRGNLAKKLAAGIALRNNQLKISDLMIGLFMNQHRLQSETALYCNRIEYRRQGDAIPDCKPRAGLWSEEEVIRISTHQDNTHYDEITRFVYIPTRPSFPGDTGFINLPALVSGEPVTFRLPLNTTCLIQHHWLVRGEMNGPFVESFKLFLPLKEYNNQHRTTRIEVTSVAGSSVRSNENVVYLLPKTNRKYITLYEEGFPRCPRDKRIKNPYSLCENLPDICDSSRRVTGTSLLPTILSTWKIKYNINSAEEIVKWNAPDPATNLLIIAKLRLRMLPDQGKRTHLQSDEDPMVEGCCNTGNQYRPFWNKRDCLDCPSKPESSRSYLGGYYCEKEDNK